MRGKECVYKKNEERGEMWEISLKFFVLLENKKSFFFFYFIVTELRASLSCWHDVPPPQMQLIYNLQLWPTAEFSYQNFYSLPLLLEALLLNRFFFGKFFISSRKKMQLFSLCKLKKKFLFFAT